jgi:hypothetical protein
MLWTPGRELALSGDCLWTVDAIVIDEAFVVDEEL